MRIRMFMPQFAPLVKSGRKRQTIRPMPKRMPKAGDLESWREWIGAPYRSPQRELAQVTLTEVKPITIKKQVFKVGSRVSVQIGPRALKSSQWHEFAVADGFATFRHLVEWFDGHHGLPFRGILIKAK